MIKVKSEKRKVKSEKRKVKSEELFGREEWRVDNEDFFLLLERKKLPKLFWD